MSRLLTAHARRCSLVLAIALVSTLVIPATAIAGAPVTTPTITAPLDGATVVSSPMLVSADSEAGFVRFVVAGQVEQTVAVSGGSAVTEIPVHGLNGSTLIEAYDCASLVSCGVSAASITVDVELTPLTITAPSRNDVVGSFVTVKVKRAYSAVRFFVDGTPVGKDLEPPFAKQISLRDRNEGEHTLMVQQCNTDGSICEGETDSVKVIKDTKSPRWTEVRASNKTVFPVNDNYKDATRLSARLSEDAVQASIEIRRAGGPIVRTINLGREGAGTVAANWNGRKANGDIVPSGRYTFRFIGEDKAGLIGRSDSKRLQVSGKELVRKTVTRTVSAKGSFIGNASGDCSGVYRLDYPQSRYGWKSGAGYYSRSKCNGTRAQDLAMGVHRVGAPRAVRHYSVKVDTYGGGAFRHAGPGVVAYVTKSGGLGKARKASAGLGWHGGPTANAGGYLKNGKMTWVFATVQGNWFDVKDFRVTFRVAVLR